MVDYDELSSELHEMVLFCIEEPSDLVSLYGVSRSLRDVVETGLRRWLRSRSSVYVGVLRSCKDAGFFARRCRGM